MHKQGNLCPQEGELNGQAANLTIFVSLTRPQNALSWRRDTTL